MRPQALPRSQPLPQQPPAHYPAIPRPCAVEAAQRWQDTSSIEGFSLEWMLDRARLLREART